ncbi:sulfotransferase 2A1-like [Ptychodera flava]|uniref:sulfotransferase 2A1-like n=1 Tax=Ptychodera flava TaxID=63121 RepID=UPI00396A4EBB
MAKEWPGFVYRGCFFTNCGYNIETVKSNPMDQWDIRPDDDVVVVTYMKSGTFWMLNLLSSLYTDLNLLLPATKKVVRLDQFYDDPDCVPGSYGKHSKALRESLDEMPSPRLLYCHMPFQFFPRAWQDGEKKCKIIYIARNPKDVCVSYYHFMQGFPWAGMDLNWDEWVRAFVDGKVWYGSWLDHVLGWRRFGLEDNVLHVTFEEMKKDLKSVLVKVADFLNRPKSDEELDDVVKKCSFASMSQGVEFYRRVSSLGDENSFLNSVQHLRKGKVGDWKNHFLVSQNEFFDREITVKAEKHGLKLVYNM